MMAGSSPPKAMGSLSLDMGRAESSRQHVRALNNQFASWVQTQLQNHPDELWEDGVRDYLTHASNIMDKFSDVVNWLKSNSKKSENLLEHGSNTTLKKQVTESKDNANASLQEKPLGVPPPPVFSNSGFANPWSSGPVVNGENLLEHSQKKLVTGSKDNVKKVSFQENTFSVPPASGTPSTFTTSSFTNSFSAPPPSGTTSAFSTSSFTNSFSAPPPSGTTSTFSTSSFTNSFSAPPPSGTTSAFSTSSFTNSFSAPPPSGTTSTFSTSSFTNSFSAPPPSGTTSMFSTSSFTNSLSTGSMFSTQSSFSFGGQSSISVKTDASNNADDDDAAEQPSSPSLKKTEEAGILVVHEVKCKLYVKSTDAADKDTWKDRGTGQLSIKCKEGVTKGTKDSKPTILVRNDVGRLLLNALLYPGIKTSMQKNSIVAIFHTADDNGSENSNVVARTFLIRTKSQEDRDKLAAAIKDLSNGCFLLAYVGLSCIIVKLSGVHVSSRAYLVLARLRSSIHNLWNEVPTRQMNQPMLLLAASDAVLYSQVSVRKKLTFEAIGAGSLVLLADAIEHLLLNTTRSSLDGTESYPIELNPHAS
ncbi:cell wall protein DAN4 [Tanacetum coccineum]